MRANGPSTVDQFIVEAVASILGIGESADISLTQPLFELGFDSARLLELNQKIAARFGLFLEASFFFERNTCARISSYIAEAVAPRSAEYEVHESQEILAGDLEVRRPPEAGEGARGGDIAIIGVSCLLPGDSKDHNSLWDLLAEGRDLQGR